MKRTVFAPNRRSVRQICRRTRYSCSTERYDLAVTIGRKRDYTPPSESASRRYFHNTRLNNNNNSNNNTTIPKNTESHQAYPLSGYYFDLLTFHQPPQQPTRTQAPGPTAPAETAEPTKEQKLSIVFGTRLAGPGYQSTRYNPETTPPESTWKQINGVPIPPRPSEPDNCCMSGCVHCVWDDYRDDLEQWAERVRHARMAVSADAATSAPAPAAATAPAKGGDMRQKPRKEVASASMSMDDDGGGSEANWDMPATPGAAEVEEDLYKGIPVGIREFMKTEKKLREKKKQQ